MVTSGSAREVDAALAIRRPHLGGKALGLPLRLLARTRTAARACATRSRSRCPGSVALPEHFGHARDRFATARGLLDDLRHHDLADFACAAGGVGRHQEVLVDAPVLGDDEMNAALGVQAADDLALARSSTSTISPSGRPRRSRPDMRDDRAIAVQHLVHLARAQEQVFAAVLRNEEAEAVGMALHDPDARGRAWRRRRAGPCDW